MAISMTCCTVAELPRVSWLEVGPGRGPVRGFDKETLQAPTCLPPFCRLGYEAQGPGICAAGKKPGSTDPPACSRSFTSIGSFVHHASPHLGRHPSIQTGANDAEVVLFPAPARSRQQSTLIPSSPSCTFSSPLSQTVNYTPFPLRALDFP